MITAMKMRAAYKMESGDVMGLVDWMSAAFVSSRFKRLTLEKTVNTHRGFFFTTLRRATTSACPPPPLAIIMYLPAGIINFFFKHQSRTISTYDTRNLASFHLRCAQHFALVSKLQVPVQTWFPFSIYCMSQLDDLHILDLYLSIFNNFQRILKDSSQTGADLPFLSFQRRDMISRRLRVAFLPTAPPRGSPCHCPVMLLGAPLVIPHVESLRSLASHYWPDTVRHEGRIPEDRPFRPSLNIRALISLIQSNKGEEGETVAEDEGNHRVGAKRQLRSTNARGTSKRRKVDVHEDRRVYPHFWTNAPEEAHRHIFSPVCLFLPAFNWSVEISYTKSHGALAEVDDVSAKEFGWLQEEEDVVSLVEELRDSASIINLGSFHPGRYLGRQLAITGSTHFAPAVPSQSESESDQWLFLLPQIVWPDNLPTQELGLYGIQNGEAHEDFLVACLTFQGARRAKVETNLELHILPQGSYDPLREMPFRLRATFTVSLAIPNIYEPVSTQRKNVIEGLQRRMMALLGDTPLGNSPHTYLSTHTEREVGDVTIPYFLSILRPAPMPLRGVMDETLQPDALIPTLLPFQRRTVSWMLDREGKHVGPDGTIVSRDLPSTADAPLPLLWERIVVGRKELFFNRLTNVVAAGPPEPNTALGGILAEEPGTSEFSLIKLLFNLCVGLGKTIECIALMLLNPAPERNPTRERWDPEAELYVKEIKVRWFSELRWGLMYP